MRKPIGVAFIVLLVFLGLIVFDDKLSKDKDITENQIVHFSQGSLFRLQIQNSFAELLLENQSGSWQLVSPIEDQVDSKMMQKLLDILLKSKSLRKIPFSKEQSLDDFGLSLDMATTLRLETAGSTQFLQIGSLVPSGNAFYLSNSRDPEHVLMIDTDWNFFKSVTLTQIRKKEIFREPLESLTGIEVSWLNNRYKLVFENGKWYYKSKDHTEEVDSAVLKQFKSYMLAVRYEEQEVIKGIDENPQSSKYYLRTYAKNGDVLFYTLQAAQVAERIEVVAPHLQSKFLVYKSSSDFLNWNHNDFMNPFKPFEMDTSLLSEIRMNNKIKLQFKNGKWVNSKGDEVATAKVNYFSKMLTNSRVKEFYVNTDGFVPKNKIELIFEDKEKKFELVWHKLSNTMVLAKTSLLEEKSKVFSFDPKALEKLINFIDQVQ